MYAPSALRFSLFFLGVFAVLVSAFEASRGTPFERLVVEDLILVPTAGLSNALWPADHIALRGRTLRSGTTGLRVIRGCEGVEMFLLLTAAIVAFPSSAKRRLQGLAVGFAVAYILSVLRLMALLYTIRHAPAAWESLHGLVLPLAPVLAIGWYFLRWSALASESGPIADSPDAA
jgi:exosortase/archaeosortase family protein